MAVPKKKTSKSKRNMRRAHDALSGINIVEDKQSGELRLPHHIGADGTYNGREVIIIPDDPEEEDQQAAG